jgi:hypothetical protein
MKNMEMKRLEEEAGREGPRGEKDGKKEEKMADRLRLVDRDRQLMGALATVRQLALEHLQRLFFAERTTTVNLEKRLLQLAGVGKHGVPHAYLRRVPYVGAEGRPKVAWALTPLGFTIADSVLPAPAKRPNLDIGPLFMRHALGLNELYVLLVEAPLRKALAEARAKAKGAERPSREFTRLKGQLYARAAHPGFRWLASDEVRLPWKQYDMKKNKHYPRHIIPDATLELPAQRQRFFLEYETGSQSIVAASDENTGSTVAKLDRYSEYLHGFADGANVGRETTWYRQQHPDGFDPVVVFLVEPGKRQQSVNAAITEWKQGGQTMEAYAVTVQEMAAMVIRGLGLEAPPPQAAAAPASGRLMLSSAEAAGLAEFFAAYRTDLKLRQASAKELGTQMPYAAKGYAVVKAMVARLEQK